MRKHRTIIIIITALYFVFSLIGLSFNPFAWVLVEKIIFGLIFMYIILVNFVGINF